MSTSQFEPRATLKGILKAWLSSGDSGGDLRNEPNSIVDAERLLTLLLPPSEIGGEFSLESLPKREISLELKLVLTDGLRGRLERNDTDRKIRDVFLNEIFTPAVTDFFDNYTDDAGEPTFSAGGYLDLNNQPVRDERGAVEVVDSYTLSVSLCVRLLRLLGRWIDQEDQSDSLEAEQWRTLRDQASKRLTAALEGLVISFTASEIPGWGERTKLEWNHIEWKDDREIARIRRRLRALGANGLRDKEPFECGWSWGPLHPKRVLHPDSQKALAQPIELSEGSQRLRNAQEGVYAEAAPYFYFTVTAIDGISDLDERDEGLGDLLTSHQLSLVSRLRSFASLTTRYWATLAFSPIARHREELRGSRRSMGLAEGWLLQDVPWIPSDGEDFASEYWTLYLLRIVLPFVKGRQDVDRGTYLLEELAQRGRVTRRPFVPKGVTAPQAPHDREGHGDLHPDPWVRALHVPGYQLPLGLDKQSAATDGQLGWRIYDYAPQLLKLIAQLTAQSQTPEQRQRLNQLMASVWQHVSARAYGSSRDEAPRWDDPARWDDPDRVFGRQSSLEERAGNKVASWYITERVTEALVAAASAELERPMASPELRTLGLALISELEHLHGSSPDIQRRIREALGQVQDASITNVSSLRQRLEDQPAEVLATAVHLAEKVAEYRSVDADSDR